MRLSKRHTEQAPAVSTPFGSLRYHRTSSVGSGQNYIVAVVVPHEGITGWIRGVRCKKLPKDSVVHILSASVGIWEHGAEVPVTMQTVGGNPTNRYLNHSAGFASFHSHYAGGGQSGTPVGTIFLRSQSHHDGLRTGVRLCELQTTTFI